MEGQFTVSQPNHVRNGVPGNLNRNFRERKKANLPTSGSSTKATESRNLFADPPPAAKEIPAALRQPP